MFNIDASCRKMDYKRYVWWRRVSFVVRRKNTMQKKSLVYELTSTTRTFTRTCRSVELCMLSILIWVFPIPHSPFQSRYVSQSNSLGEFIFKPPEKFPKLHWSTPEYINNFYVTRYINYLCTFLRSENTIICNYIHKY